MVAPAGLEPAHSQERKILSLLRLPFRQGAIYSAMQELRQFIRLLLKEAVSVPKIFTDKTGKEFLFGPGAKDKIKKSEAESGFGFDDTVKRHPIAKQGIFTDAGLIAFKLNTLNIDQFNRHDAAFEKYATSNLSKNWLKAMAIEETLVGSNLLNNDSTADGVLQVIDGTLAYLNKKRGWLGLPPYKEASLVGNPALSIKIAAEYINKHMLAPKQIIQPDDRNIGGFNYSIDQMLSKYKTGPDGPFYAERVKVYKRFLDKLDTL